MKHFRIFSLVLLFALLTAGGAAAQTAYPMLMSLKPTAAQVGTTSEHTISSRYSMYGAYQVIVSGEGVAGEIVHPEIKEEDKAKPPNLQTMKVRFTVAADATSGVRDFRIATPHGASTVGQLVIVREPVVSEAEKEKNDNPAQAQQVTVPATICGAIEKAEDVDYYKFQVEAGAALNFHVECMRLQNRIHDLQQHADPILTLRNAAGVTLAASDNFFYGDPLIDYVFPQAGEYLLEVRDVRYQGNQYWQYSIEISPRPFVTNVYPLGVTAGEPTKLELVGFRLPEQPIEFTPPANTPVGPAWLPLPLEGDVGQASSLPVTNPAPLVISDLPLAAETDAANDTWAEGQLVAIPAGINGRIGAEADVDCFAFEAKKGEKFSFEVIARRQQSSLDAQLRIIGEGDKQYQLNDDMRLGKRGYADSLIENWTAPADGKYAVEIRDVHLRGGPSFVYFIKATRSEPYFSLYADTDKTQLTPGGSSVVFVRVERKNGFDGEVQLAVEGLPAGVTADCGRILAGKPQDGCIVLTAAADAPQSIADITIRGTANVGEGDAMQTLASTATVYQETYQPGGGRGHWPVETHAVCVGEPGDILSVTLSEYDVTLEPGESKQIDVTIERAEGFDKNVTLDLLYRHLNSVYGDPLPPGVTIDAGKSKTLLTAGATTGSITLKAAADAQPVQKQQAALMANISLNFVMKATYASKPLLISVVKWRPAPCDVLVFAPHPDDEVLGCTGVILQALAEGKRVGVVVLTNGDGYPKAASVFAKKPQEKLTTADFDKLSAERQQQSINSERLLGVPSNNLMFLGYPDSGLAEMYQAEDGETFRQKYTKRDATYGIVAPDYHSLVHGRPAPYTKAAVLADIAEIIATCKPQEIYVTHEVDRHADHRAAYWFVRDAARAASFAGKLYAFVVHGQERPELPEHRVSLTAAQVEKKKNAIQAHQIPTVHDALVSYAQDEEIFWLCPLDASPARKTP